MTFNSTNTSEFILEICGLSLNQPRRRPDAEYLYMMLDRHVGDLKYYLGNGERYEKCLWSGNIDKHINNMRCLYMTLKVKPEWLSAEDIDEYVNIIKEVDPRDKTTAEMRMDEIANRKIRKRSNLEKAWYKVCVFFKNMGEYRGKKW